jgi:SAM-dependent methyltransferase
MEHEYYKEYYDLERGHWWFVAREIIIINYLQTLIRQRTLPQGKLTILNIGCGTGRSSEYLAGFGEVTSIEHDPFCCQFTEARTGLKIIQASITELPLAADSFDLVCALDVIEHVADDQRAVAEMKRVARPGGVVLITVPALMSLWSFHDVVNHHHRRYVLPEIKKLFLQPPDGAAVSATYFNFFLFPPILLYRRLHNLIPSQGGGAGSGSDFGIFKPSLTNTILAQVMSWERWLVSRRIRLPFGVSILFAWRKKEQTR